MATDQTRVCCFPGAGGAQIVVERGKVWDIRLRLGRVELVLEGSHAYPLGCSMEQGARIRDGLPLELVDDDDDSTVDYGGGS